MKQLAGYIVQYIRELNKPAFFFISVLTGFFIFLNYQFHIESSLLHMAGFSTRFTGFLLLYLVVFGGSYVVLYSIKTTGTAPRFSPFLISLLFASAAIFAWRMASRLITSSLTASFYNPWDRYWALILNPPVKCVVMLLVIYVIQQAGSYNKNITGLHHTGSPLRPFFIALLCFAPVVLIAALQPEFRLAYPKAAKVNFVADQVSQPWVTALIFEISYAFDFVVAEVFFRGFLVLAFIRYAGPAAILPMASFYCAIHFGKPLVECISSFFGAIVLGAITWRTGSVLGGLALHLGIGWMMELAGFLLR